MGQIKRLRGKIRKVVFTDLQMIQAQQNPKFNGKSHRDFVAWLFEHQHKMRVINFDFLTYKYHPLGQTKACEVSGQVGLALDFI
jgi:hypothetical protein